MIRAEMIDHMGSDLRCVDAARVSFDKASEWDRTSTVYMDGTSPKELKREDQRLIAYLARHDHFTPFTHCVITLRETVPIFVARQRFKHVVGFSYNEVSRRYVSDTPEVWVPETFRRAADDKKQGSGGTHPRSGIWRTNAQFVVNQAIDFYNRAIADGMCPEQARAYLPQAAFTSYYVTGSLYAFARAYNLRSQPDAQAEIRELAEQWDRIIRPLFPVSWSALTLTPAVDPATTTAKVTA